MVQLQPVPQFNNIVIMYKCKYCGKEFINSYSIGGNTSMCKLNPNYKENIKKRIPLK